MKQGTHQAYTAKIIIAINYFRKTLYCRCLQGSKYTSGFAYASVENIPGF